MAGSSRRGANVRAATTTTASITASVRIDSSTAGLAALFLSFDLRLASLDGADTGPVLPGRFLLPELETAGLTQVAVTNPNNNPASLDLELVSAGGSVRGSVSRTIGPNGALVETAANLFPGTTLNSSDYLRGAASQKVTAFEFLEAAGRDARALNGQDAAAGSTVLYSPQYVVGGGFQSVITVVNLDPVPGTVALQLFNDQGVPIGAARQLPVGASGKLSVQDPSVFGDFGSALLQGHVEIRSSGPKLAGSIAFGGADGQVFSASLPLIADLHSNRIFGHVASNGTYYTGIAVVNPNSAATAALVEVHDRSGRILDSGEFPVAANGRISKVLTEYFPSLIGRNIDGGYIRVRTGSPAAAFAVFGTHSLTVLSAIKGQDAIE